MENLWKIKYKKDTKKQKIPPKKFFHNLNFSKPYTKALGIVSPFFFFTPFYCPHFSSANALIVIIYQNGYSFFCVVFFFRVLTFVFCVADYHFQLIIVFNPSVSTFFLTGFYCTPRILHTKHCRIFFQPLFFFHKGGSLSEKERG